MGIKECSFKYRILTAPAGLKKQIMQSESLSSSILIKSKKKKKKKKEKITGPLAKTIANAAVQAST